MDSPKIPDPNTAALAGAKADLENYPFRYAIEALAKKGGKQVINGREYDFTGLGDADSAATISDQMAQALLDIQKNNGADFVKQRLDDLKRADPTGYAARKQLFDKIRQDAEAQPNRPLADDTQKQIMSLLQQGGKLSPREEEQVQQAVRGKQLKSGIYLGNAPASEEASSVEGASEKARTARQQQALQFQTAGISPEDVEYRRIQQSLANLGAFVSGQKPTAQFGSLSAAGNGAAPFTNTGPVNQATDPNATVNGINNANSIWNIQNQYAQGQVSPLVSGISGGLNGVSTYVKLGGANPFLTNTTGVPLTGSTFGGGAGYNSGGGSIVASTEGFG